MKMCTNIHDNFNYMRFACFELFTEVYILIYSITDRKVHFSEVYRLDEFS